MKSDDLRRAQALMNFDKSARKIRVSWKCTSSILLLHLMILSCIVLYISQHYSIAILDVGKLVFRMVILKSEERVFAIYDPYVPHIAKLKPDDWKGWPLEALEAKAAIDKLQILREPFGDIIRLNKADMHFVDDRAAAFAYQPDVSEIRNIREKYNLPTLLGRGASQITELATLNDWVRRQWTHGTSGPVNLHRFNAVDIIESARKGAQYWCHIAAMVFTQAAISMGYQARLLSLSLDKGDPGHAVAEVWVDDLNKWVVFDTDFNLYYVDKFGLPLNALELHQAFVRGKSSDLTVIKGAYRPESFDIEKADTQPLLLPFYRYFYLDMRNDWLSNAYFPGHPKRSDFNSLRWQDNQNDVGFLDLKPITSYERELYWSLNQVEIRLDVNTSNETFVELIAHMKTITPNFAGFEVSINDSPGVSHYSSHLIWPLRPGANTLTVRALNTFGVKGPPTHLQVLWNH